MEKHYKFSLWTIAGLCTLLINTSYSQVGGKNRQPVPIPGKTQKGGVINYPAPANIQYLRRNHFAYNLSSHSFDKNYITKKYQLFFKVPHDIIQSVGYIKEGAIGPNGKKGKPKFQTEWFSPIMVIKNLDKNTVRFVRLNDLVLRGVLDFYATALIEGSGNYEIRFEQNFPKETEFRQKMRSIYVFPSPGDEVIAQQQERERAIDSLVNKFAHLLGNRTSTPLYRFSANYDFLVASIGDSYAAGEGNPMGCGQDNGGGVFDTFSELYQDIKEHANGVVDGVLALDEEGLRDALTSATAILTLSPALEQVIGACTITEANMAGLMKPNFDVPPGWIENGETNDNTATSRSYINPTAPSTFHIEDKYKGMAVTYLNYASSGATSEHLFRTNQHRYQKGTHNDRGSQIDELARNLQNSNREIDALVIAIGANDIAFSNIMGDLMSNQARNILQYVPIPAVAIALAHINSDRLTIRNKIIAELNKMDVKFFKLDSTIRARLKVKKVFLLEYPNAQFTKKNSQGNIEIADGCGVLKFGSIGFDKEDAELVTELGTLLNNRLKELSKKYGWVFVQGATEAFKGHGYCVSPNDTYFRAAETSCNCQGNYQGMLHPNLKGFQAIKPLVLQALENEFSFNRLKGSLTASQSNGNASGR